MTKERIDIRDLVHWALVDQQVEAAVAAARRATGSDLQTSLDSALKVENIARLGARVDGRGPTGEQVLVNCHQDAIEVYEAICALPGKARDFVYFHGKKRTAPDWVPEGVGQREPLLGANGKPMRDPDVIVDGKLIKEGKRYFTYDGYSPETVRRCRAEYGVWWEALAALAQELEKNLIAFSPYEPGVSRMPWECETIKVAG